jgi:RimJ/RimL family protein N-acetyltransferase
MKDRKADEFSEQWTLDDGTQLLLRHIETGDFPMLRAFVDSLSFGTRYFRYGSGDVSFSDDRLRNVCMPDPGACVHYLVLKKCHEAHFVVGSARINFTARETTGELGITVHDDWQSRGIGQHLVKALLDSVRQGSLREVRAYVLATNVGMIEFMRRCGFDIADVGESSGIKVATFVV